MKKVLIGSKAMQYWFKDFNRIPKDTDYAVSEEIKSATNEIELLYNPVLTKTDVEVATPEMMLALKISHLFWEKDWRKHMWDVQFLLDKGVKFNYEIYKENREFFEEYLPKIRRSDLNQDKESFFDNAVNEDSNEHDIYHTLIAEIPAYTKILKEGCEVELDFDKFEKLSYQEKLDVAIEEAVVMAYERYSGKIPWYKAFDIQLIQNIMKHYPEPIALFSIFNYKNLTNLRKHNIEGYFKKLNYDSKRI